MTAAKKKRPAALSEMDVMFGVDPVPLGDTTILVRRVLSRTQQRVVGGVAGLVHQVSLDLGKLLKPPVEGEDGITPDPLTEDEVLAAVEALEESMHQDLMRGVEVFVTNPETLFLEEWSTPALSQLFNTLQQRSLKSVSQAVGAHFPTSGPTE